MSARILTHFEQNVKVKRPFSGSKSLYIMCILSGLGHIRADLMIIYTQYRDMYIWCGASPHAGDIGICLTADNCSDGRVKICPRHASTVLEFFVSPGWKPISHRRRCTVRQIVGIK